MAERDINVRLRVRDDGTVVLRGFGDQVERTAGRGQRALNRMGGAARRTTGDLAFLSNARNWGIDRLESGINRVTSLVVGSFVVRGLLRFVNELKDAAREATNNFRGLRAVAEFTGVGIARAFQEAQKLAADGLLTFSDASKALQNLLQRGYNIEQAVETLNNLKNAAAFNRAAHLSLSEAVLTATEGLKNENSILVDNAGVTKNVSVIWKEYADTIGVGVNSLDQHQKVLAEVAGIQRETAAQAGNAAKAAEGAEGSFARWNKALLDTKTTIGGQLIPTLAGLADIGTFLVKEVFVPIATVTEKIRKVSSVASLKTLFLGAARGAEPLRKEIAQILKDMRGIGDTFRLGITDQIQDELNAVKAFRQSFAESRREVKLFQETNIAGRDVLQRQSGTLKEVATDMDRLKEATERLNQRQKRALSDAQAFVDAQSEILQAQFDARAPSLETDDRLRQQQELNRQLEQLQIDLLQRELQIARDAARERGFLITKLVGDEEKAATLRLKIKEDLAAQELDIERRKRQEIRRQLVASLDEEARLRQQAADAFDLADEIEKQARDAGKTQRQLVDETFLEAIRKTGQEAIDAWQRYVELGGDAFTAVRRIREEARKLEEESDQAGDRTRDLAQEYQTVQQQIEKAEEALRKLTEERDLKTTVTLDDSAFRRFIAELAKPSEHTVQINAVEGRREGGPAIHARAGRRIPGYGGGDKVDAVLERGEWVLRKEVERVTGGGFLRELNAHPGRIMALLNGLRIEPPPIYRQSGGPVGDAAARGGSGGALDVVRIELDIGGDRVSGVGDRDLAEGLSRALKGLRSSVAGGV